MRRGSLLLNEYEDGSIVVGSSSDPLKTYRLVGTACECQDFTRNQAPEGWCRHRIASGIQKRVTQVLATPPVPVVPEDLPEPWPDNDPEPEELPPAQPVPAPTPGPCPEALFSLTLKGTLDGQEALLTARGQTAAEFKRNLEAIRGLLDPVRRVEAQRAPQGQGWCAVHQVQMRLNRGKNGQSDWYSHRTRELTWCKGK